MNIKELRYGNLVIDNIGIVEIGKNAKLEFCDIYNPILINEEWLLKFGFEFDNYHVSPDFETENDYNPIQYYKLKINKYCNYFFGLMPDNYNEFGIKAADNEIVIKFGIKYVHQLQNLYYTLTEKELICEKN
jgi:hypothetical protein